MIVALSQSVDNALAIAFVYGGFAVVIGLVVVICRRIWRFSNSTPRETLRKINGRYIWGGLVALGTVPNVVSPFRREAVPAAVIDAMIPLVIGSVIYRVGIAIYRALVNRDKHSSILPVATKGPKPRQRKNLGPYIFIAVLIAVIVAGLVLVKGPRPDYTKQATLTDYYPCLDATKVQQTFIAGKSPPQTLIDDLISLGKTASDPVIRQGAAQISAAYQPPISNQAGLDVVAGIGTIVTGCRALHVPSS